MVKIDVLAGESISRVVEKAIQVAKITDDLVKLRFNGISFYIGKAVAEPEKKEIYQYYTLALKYGCKY